MIGCNTLIINAPFVLSQIWQMPPRSGTCVNQWEHWTKSDWTDCWWDLLHVCLLHSVCSVNICNKNSSVRRVATEQCPSLASCTAVTTPLRATSFFTWSESVWGTLLNWSSEHTAYIQHRLHQTRIPITVSAEYLTSFYQGCSKLFSLSTNVNFEPVVVIFITYQSVDYYIHWLIS